MTSKAKVSPEARIPEKARIPQKARVPFKAQIQWQNGTPHCRRFRDCYFPEKNARDQARRIFIQGNGLPERWEHKSVFTIGELGFGTGLNFLETFALWREWREWRKGRAKDRILDYFAIDAYPMSASQMKRALANWPDLRPDAERLANALERMKTEPCEIDSQTRLRLIAQEAFDALDHIPQKVDAWYLDGFSPAKNPQIWRKEVIDKIAEHTDKADRKNAGTIASYTSAGWVRRNLIQAGFEVQKVEGVGNKRHSIKGQWKSP